MNADTLVLIASAVLSLGFSYIPGLNTGYAALSPVIKRLIMAGLLLGVSLYAFGEACTGIGLLGVTVTCDQDGAVGLIRVFIFAVMANQGAYNIVQQPKEVIAVAAKAKEEAKTAETKAAEGGAG